MTPEEIVRERQPGDVLGDYKLVELVSRGAGTRTWKAEQISIQRPVMLEVLKQDWAQDADVRDAFLADVRAKAAINHPVIGHVYEAHSDEFGTYLAREVLDGTSLEDLHEAGKQFTPREVVAQIEAVAEAFDHLEQASISTVELSPHHIVLNENTGKVRLMNLAVYGAPSHPDQSKRDKVLLGELYDDLLIKGRPGSVRSASLLDHMADTTKQVPLTWDQIHRLAKQVREELSDTETLQEVVAEKKKAARSRALSANIWAILGGVGLILALLYFFSQGDRGDETGEVVEDLPELPAPVTVNVENARFLMDAHEVTIGQYAKFIDALEKLPEDQRGIYDHPLQPETKTDHLPNDWKALYAAALSRGEWSGRKVNENCPVIGVDFWDAHAYAAWDRARLPSAREWLAAAAADFGTMGVSDWGDATLSKEDRTGLGLVGTAGNVSEWTSTFERNPAFPLDPKQPVVCGGSFAAPAEGGKTRTFLKSRDVRRDDLGFRTVRKLPEEKPAQD